MTCQMSSMRAGSLPMSASDSSSTAARTVAALPSMTGSPQPLMPSSVVIFRNSHLGAAA